MKIKIILFLCMFVLLQAQAAAEAEDFKIVNIKKDTTNLIELAAGKDFFVILFSWSYSCFDCFKDIVKSLDSLDKQNKNLEYIFVCNSDNSSLERRKQIEAIQQFKKDAKVYFDIYNFDIYNNTNNTNNKNTASIFRYYKVEKSPAILHIKNKKLSYISYNDFIKGNHKYYNMFKKLLLS